MRRGATLRVVGNVGPLELVVVLIIALVIFGPKRVPELGKSLGKGIREFQSAVAGHGDDKEEELDHGQAPEAPGSGEPPLAVKAEATPDEASAEE